MRNRFFAPGLLFLILALSRSGIYSCTTESLGSPRVTAQTADRAGTANTSGKSPRRLR